MELLQGLSDDQTALLGCVVALTVCGGLLSVSALVGRTLRKSQPSAADVPAMLRLTPPQTTHTAADAAHRRAA